MYMGTPGLLNTLLVVRKFLTDEMSLKANEIKIHEELIGLRNQNRERERYDDGWKWKSRAEDYDRAWAKKTIPYEMSESEIKEFIAEEWRHWYNPYEDGRDCTGVWFTTSIRCFPIQGKTFIYHFKSCDV